MELSATILLMVNFILVCSLPLIFFRKDGKKNLMWMVTAAPYVIAPSLMFAIYFGLVTPTLTTNPSVFKLIQALAVLLSISSIIVMALTLGTHRIPVALWHQKHEDDKPVEIVTWGAYSKIRHPFYCSFILLMLANLLWCLHWGALILFFYVYLMLNYTAAMEESRLANETSGMGNKYQQYIQITGRFFPKMSV